MSIGIHSLKSYFTASFNALAGLNFGRTLAGILIASPVLGFLPFRAFRLTILKVPKPERKTSSLFFKVFLIKFNIISTVITASFFVLVNFANSLTKSAFFITHLQVFYFTSSKGVVCQPSINLRFSSSCNAAYFLTLSLRAWSVSI